MTIRPGLSYYAFHILWGGLDLFFPPRCGGCGKLGERWCANCQRQLTPLPQPLCEICGEPQQVAGICNQCASTRPAFFALRSCAVFKEPLRPALHKLKYRRDIGLGEALAWNVAFYLETLGWQAEMIIPVPLSQQRMRERGYNQAGLIAHPLSRIMRWQYRPGALQRTRHTRSQVGLTVTERRENVHAAFTVNAGMIQNKTVLLFDDVATTGATLNAASQVLLSAGAARIYALTVAKALQRYGLDQVKQLSPRSSR